MKKISLLLIMLVFISACDKKTTEEEVGSTNVKPLVVSCSKATEYMDDGAILVDVRSKEEYNVSHLDGAVNAPVEGIETMIEGIVPSKDTTIIVYCRSGNRSLLASEKLISMGYKLVYDLGAMDKCIDE